jgi:hypothetical protein
MNKYAKIRWPETLAALANILLVVVTICYVVLTSSLVNMQNDQFQLTNRGRIVINNCFPQGDINSGVVNFVNQGNLPVRKLKIAWRIIYVENGSVIKSSPISLEESLTIKDTLEPDELFPAYYNAPFGEKDQFVFLVLCWKYSGKGIKEEVVRDAQFLWDVKEINEKIGGEVKKYYQTGWSIPGRLDEDNIKSIIDTKFQLKTILNNAIF